MKADKDLLKRMVADLARSGLTLSDAKLLGIRLVNAEKMETLTGFAVEGYQLPVFGPKRELRTNRYRALPRPGATYSGPKYLSQKQESNRFFFSPLQIRPTWQSLLVDSKTAIAITEGEKKASAACKAGLPTVGIGGVWSFVFATGSKKEGSTDFGRSLRASKDFDLIDWEGREVLLIFDSDVVEKINVELALNALAGELLKRGAKPLQILLPSKDGKKVGLDDFLVANRFDIDRLLALERRKFTGAQKLFEINERYGVLSTPAGHIMRKNEGERGERVTLMRPDAFHTDIAHIKAERASEIQFLKQMGRTQTLSHAWLEWPYRAQYKRIDYLPGNPRVLEDGTFNLWNGWPFEAKRGNVTPFKDLFYNFVAKNLSASDRRWLLQWFAYPIQNPGAKLASAVLIIGKPGSGKNLFCEMVSAVYGQNAGILEGSRLHDDFNNFLLGKQFMVGDEVFSSDKRKEINAFKLLVTREKSFINQKHIAGFYISDAINWVFLSNDYDPLFLKADDRRYFVIEMGNDVILEAGIGTEYGKWLRTSEGASALFYHLKKEVDCSGFNPRARPPVTVGKKNVIELSLSDLDRWARDIVENGAGALYPFDKIPALDVSKSDDITPPRKFSADFPSELFELPVLASDFDSKYRRNAAAPTSQNAVARALRNAGAVPIPSQIRLPDEVRIRVWAIKDTSKWLKARHDELVAYVKDYLPTVTPVKSESEVLGSEHERRASRRGGGNPSAGQNR